VILGPPGSGKGTYASRLRSELGIPAVAAGDILREMARSETVLGKSVKSYIGKGTLVPDDIVIKVFRNRLSRKDCERGFILDGYPRTITQAQALDRFAKIDAVVLLLVPEWIIIERLSSRRICRKCGEVYNIRFLKPRREGTCDRCEGPLYQRIDDTQEVIKERVAVYERQTQPLIDYYKGRIPFVEFKCEDIDTPPEVAVKEILKGLNRLEPD
jgi:adenylate kinase